MNASFSPEKTIAEIIELWKAASPDRALEALSLLAQHQSGELIFQNLVFKENLDIVLPEVQDVTFRRCSFTSIKIRGIACQNLRFLDCTFRGDRFEVEGLDVLNELKISSQSRTPDSRINWQEFSIRGNGEGRLSNLTVETDLEIVCKKISMNGLVCGGINFRPKGLEKLILHKSKFEAPAGDWISKLPTGADVLIESCLFVSELVIARNLNSTGTFQMRKCQFKHSLRILNSHFERGLLLADIDVNEGSELLIDGCQIHGDYNFDLQRPRSLAISGGMESLSVRQTTAALGMVISDSGDREIGQLRISGGDTRFLDVESLTSKLIQIQAILIRQEFNFAGVTASELQIVDLNPLLKLRLNKAKLGLMTLRGCKLSGPAQFVATTFRSAPLFDSCELYFDTSFRRCSFKDKSGSSEGAYRQLKHKMKEIGNEGDENRFASYEITARISNLGWAQWFEWLLSIGYYFVNRCGRSIIQPLIVLSAMISIFYWGYYVTPGSIRIANPVKQVDWISDVQAWDYHHQAWLYSFINALGPARLLIPTGVFQASTPAVFVGTVSEILLSSIVWYFFVFGIRRRFRIS